MTGERDGKSIIGGIEHILRRVEEGKRFAILAERDLDQRKLEHDLRLVRIERQRILVRRFRRSKASAGEISVAEQSTEAGVVRSLGYGPLGEVDRHRDVVGIERGHRAGGETDLSVRLAAEARRNVALRRGAAGGQRCKREKRERGAVAKSSSHWITPSVWPFEPSHPAPA